MASEFQRSDPKSGGSIVAWGSSSCGQCEVPPPNAGFLALAAGGLHSLGLKGYPRGDLNCDGVVNYDDIDRFVLALSDPAGYAAGYPDRRRLNGDCNCDGFVDFDDISAFVAILSR
jgi:hypothetical protein